MNDKTSAVTMGTGSVMYITGEAGKKTANGTEARVEQKKGMSPKIYFKYIKSKFGFLAGKRLKNRIKKLWALAEESDEFGQIALSEKYIKMLSKEMRECEMYALGYKIFIEEEHLEKLRYKVKGTHISVTKLENYVKNIPKDVVADIKKAKSKNIFDEFVVIHYDPNKEAAAMTEEEERKDPIVFGTIEESDRYYFIADWEDEYCDLTLDDIVDKLGLEDEEMLLTKNIKVKK